jgi:hypothetical protein
VSCHQQTWLLISNEELSMRSSFALVSFPHGTQPPVGHSLHILEVSRSHSVRHTIFSRTPLDELSARRRNFYLTTHNSHNKQISIPAAGFQPAIPTCGPPQTPLFRLLTICVFKRNTLWYCTIQYILEVMHTRCSRFRPYFIAHCGRVAQSV